MDYIAFVHLSNLSDRQTDKQTDKQTDPKTLPPPAEVMITVNRYMGNDTTNMRSRVAIQRSHSNADPGHCDVSSLSDHGIVGGQSNLQYLPIDRKYF